MANFAVRGKKSMRNLMKNRKYRLVLNAPILYSHLGYRSFPHHLRPWNGSGIGNYAWWYSVSGAQDPGTALDLDYTQLNAVVYGGGGVSTQQANNGTMNFRGMSTLAGDEYWFDAFVQPFHTMWRKQLGGGVMVNYWSPNGDGSNVV